MQSERHNQPGERKLQPFFAAERRQPGAMLYPNYVNYAQAIQFQWPRNGPIPVQRYVESGAEHLAVV